MILMVMKNPSGGYEGGVVRDCFFRTLFHLHCLFVCLFVCLSCGLVSTTPTFTLLEVKKDDLMFLEVPDGVHTFALR